MIRVLDVTISILGLTILSPLFFFIFILGLIDTGSPLFFQKRVGINLSSFRIVKFRTMKIGTFSKGTHLIDQANITVLGYYLRKYKIDELPQLWNVLMGDMSLVGPRPCLHSQKRLINERKKRKVFKVKPGITGFPQINGITMAKPKLLARQDLIMITNMNLKYYFFLIYLTFQKFFIKKL